VSAPNQPRWAPRFARIVATGSYLPEREVTNAELAERMPASAEYLGKMAASTGITRRYWAPEDWAASDLAVPACRQALERAGRTPEEVDLIVLGTDSPDFLTPATSVVVQHKLGAKNAGTFDVGCACASFPTGFAAAAGMMAVNPALRVVLVADPNDPTIFFYGDGAGAAVLEPSSEPGFISSALRADGAYHKFWGIYSGASAEPASEQSLREGRTKVRFIERYPPEVNHQGWPRVVRSLAENGGFAVSDIDFLIFTQVRKPSIELVMADLGLPMDRTHTIMEKWGYTGSACVPMALHDALEEGKIEKGDLVVLVGSGVGYNQAGVALRWS
jgi:3-oxoacyl-[acyl-carrier-protein] synthase-3